MFKGLINLQVYMKYNDTLFDLPKYIESDKTDKPAIGKPRLKIPVRNQIEVTIGCLDDFIPDDHKVRSVAKYVSQLDLSSILCKIKSVDSSAGAPATSPEVLLTLWLYAFIEGIVSARTINRYCTEHIAFKWICGNKPVNEHTISDFRSKHGEAFDELLTQSIAVLSHQGLINIVERIAQDGMKVEANAGKSSFRREKTLKSHLKEAEAYVNALKKEFAEDPSSSLKQKAARMKAAEEKLDRTKHAVEELKKLRKQKEDGKKKWRKTLSEKEKEDTRASKTDPEARIMKMPNSGFAPAYNIQFATDTKSKAIVGVKAVQSGNDYGQLEQMKQQVEKRLGYSIKEIIADGGYLEHEDIKKVSSASCIAYIPAERIDKKSKCTTLTEMKKRMDTPEAKVIYNQRAETAEFVNARVRTRGFTQVLVRGLSKVQVLATFFAVGQNMLIWMSNQ
jgi:transposase